MERACPASARALRRLARVRSRMSNTRLLVGEAVRRRRQACGLSSRGAAALGDIGHSTWNQVETGRMNPTLSTLEEVARVLKCEWVVRLVPEAERLDAQRQSLLDRVAAIVDLLDDRDVRHLLAQVAHLEEEPRAHRHSRK